MKKFFSKRKAQRGGEEEQQAAARGTPLPPAAAPAAAPAAHDIVPPLPLERLAGAGGSGRPPYTPGTPLTPPYSASGYLTSANRTLSGASSGGGRSLGRTTSGLSSGRRSARRPRELIEFPPPEQVDGMSGAEEGSSASWSGGSEEGGGGGGSAMQNGGAAPGPSTASASQAAEQAAERERLDQDLAMAYQLAFQQEAAAAAAAAGASQQPPPALFPQAQQQQQPAAPPWQQPWQQAPVAHSLPLPAMSPGFQQQQAAALQHHQSLLLGRQSPAQQPAFPLHGSLPLPRRMSRTSGDSRATMRSDDMALAAALAESQFQAQQQSRAAELARTAEEEYQVRLRRAGAARGSLCAALAPAACCCCWAPTDHAPPPAHLGNHPPAGGDRAGAGGEHGDDKLRRSSARHPGRVLETGVEIGGGRRRGAGRGRLCLLLSAWQGVGLSSALNALPTRRPATTLQLSANHPATTLQTTNPVFWHTTGLDPGPAGSHRRRHVSAGRGTPGTGRHRIPHGGSKSG